MIGGSQKATALLASFLLASPALAEPKGPSDKDKQLAGEYVKKAIAKSDAGDHDAAIDLYIKAYTLIPNALLLSNIGAEYEQNDKPSEALRYFCMYLEKDPAGPSAPFATSKAKAMQIQLGNKHVDDEDVCAKPKIRKTDPPKPPKPPPPPPPPPEDPPPPSGNSTLKYVGVGAGLVGLGALGLGAYAGVKAKNISDEITNHDKTQPWPDGIQQVQKRGQDYENLQIEALVAGGVLVTAGVILFVLSRPDESAKRSTDTTTVRVTPTTNGFAVFGTF
jgi:tetratricopeptide (TPR) repeat protein